MKFIRVLKASNFMEEDEELARMIDVYCDDANQFSEEDIEEMSEKLAYTFEEVRDFILSQGYQIKES